MSRYSPGSRERHGTLAGVKRHAQNGTPVCLRCLYAACEQERNATAYYLAALRAFPRHAVTIYSKDADA